MSPFGQMDLRFYPHENKPKEQRQCPETGLLSREALLCLTGIMCNLVKQGTETCIITVFLQSPLTLTLLLSAFATRIR